MLEAAGQARRRRPADRRPDADRGGDRRLDADRGRRGVRAGPRTHARGGLTRWRSASSASRRSSSPTATRAILVDPFITGQPEGDDPGRRAGPDAHPAHPRPRRPLRRHGRAIAKRTGAPVLAIVEIADELAELGLRDVFDPNFGGTVAFDWGWVKLVPAWHSSTTPNGTVCPPAGLLIMVGDTLVYHLGDTALFSDLQADRPARQPRQRGARADRRPLHDGPLRRRDRVRVDRRRRGDPRSTTTRSRRSRPTPQAFKSDVENATETKVVSWRRARPTPSGDPRDRPDRGRAGRDAATSAARSRTSRASPRPGR